MRTIIALAMTLTLGGAASAASNSANFCLRGQSGATQGTETCSYQTLAQCNAAKAGQNDQCFRNTKAKSKTTTGSKQ